MLVVRNSEQRKGSLCELQSQHALSDQGTMSTPFMGRHGASVLRGRGVRQGDTNPRISSHDDVRTVNAFQGSRSRFRV